MHSRRVWGLAMPLAGMLAAGIAATPASADVTQQFNCSAAVAQLSAPGASLPIGSYVSNAGNSVCADAQNQIGSGGGTISLGLLGLGGNLTITGGGSTTSQVADDTQMTVNSVASLNGVTLPTAAGNITIPGTAQATATLSCVNNQVQSTVGSTLASLNVGGQQINLPSAGATETIPLTTPTVLGVPGVTIGSVTVNPSSVTSTGATQALLDVNLLNAGHIVLGRATASSPTGNPCVDIPSVLPPGPTGPTGPGGGTGSTGPSGSTGSTGSAGPSGSNGTSGSTGSTGSTGSSGSNGTSGSGSNGSAGSSGSNGACPAGTTQLSSGACALGASGSQSSTIVERANANDISGGRVISLANARKLYRGATCLNGAGPKFVVVGTRGNDKITVRKLRMRVLGLAGNDRISVVGGANTCVNGGAGKDTITNMQRNKVKIYGANGNDRLTVGNGPAIVAGGNGNDTITAGLGRVNLSGGAGNNKITALGKVAFVSAGRGTSVARLQMSNRTYAMRHGVKRVSLIKR